MAWLSPCGVRLPEKRVGAMGGRFIERAAVPGVARRESRQAAVGVEPLDQFQRADRAAVMADRS